MTSIKSTPSRTHHVQTSGSAPEVRAPDVAEVAKTQVSRAATEATEATIATPPSRKKKAEARQAALGKEKAAQQDLLGKRVDRNGDGVVSDVEKRLAEGREKARKLVKHFDSDGDGQLKGAEIPEQMRGADKDSDGVVTKQELRRAFNGNISREERFKGFDSDGDGVLSGKELADPRFARGRDHDGDGKVTQEEFLKGRQKDAAPGAAAGPGAAQAAGDAPPTAANGDVFAAAQLDRSAPPKVSWYHPHRQNETPTLRISGNVTSENFFREAALASMNVGMSPRRMTSVLQEALPTALEGLGVKLDAGGRGALANTIRQRTAGLPRANPIPSHLHPDTTGKYLDDNPAAAGWRDSAWARSLVDRLSTGG
ncbi:MAG: EF-hand domain-containing protein [Myxococcota bacterium]